MNTILRDRINRRTITIKRGMTAAQMDAFIRNQPPKEETKEEK